MSGLLDLANRLERASERIAEVTVHAFGEVIGEEMQQDFEDHRDTGRLADTLEVTEGAAAVDFKTRHYRQYVGRFRKGIPLRTLQIARALAAARVAALFGGSDGGGLAGVRATHAAGEAKRKAERRERAAAKRKAKQQ